MVKEQEKPEFQLASPWQFALAILSNWHKTVATVIVVMLLGWPMVVAKRWLEDAGVLASVPGTEQSLRQQEHASQDKVHSVIADAVLDQASISKSILLELKNHNQGASQDRQMLAYFTWKQCITDNGPKAEICTQFEPGNKIRHAH
jgi:hypothetical protein